MALPDSALRLVRAASATSKVSVVAVPFVNALPRSILEQGSAMPIGHKKARHGAGWSGHNRNRVGRVEAEGKVEAQWQGLRPETGWFNQANLVAAGREFTTLIALNHNATSGFHADHPSTNPAKGCRFENLHHIAGL